MTTSQQLADQFDVWATERWGADDGNRRSDVELFLDWRTNYSTGELTEFRGEDLDEFLLEWCPRKLSAPPELAATLCRSTGQYVEFLHTTGLGFSDSGRAARLINHADSLADEMKTAMADPTKFGMAKSLFFGAGSDLPDMSSTDDLQAWLDARMAEHNALPFEERRAVTDHLFTPPLHDLPFVYLPSPASEVENAAAAAPILQTLQRLRGHLGTDGRKLTASGHLMLADARTLIERLGTGDTMDPVIQGRPRKTRSSQDLPGLQYVVETAIAAGAVRRLRGHLVPVKAWGQRTPLAQLTAVWDALFDIGFLSIVPRRSASYQDLDELAEDGLPHWLIQLIPMGSTCEVTDLVAALDDVVANELPTPWNPEMSGYVGRLLRRAEDMGLLHWHGGESTPSETGLPAIRTGGVIELTPVGRHLAASVAEQVGYRLEVLDLATGSGRELLDALGTNQDLDLTEVLGQWRADDPDRTRAELLADALRGGSDAVDRLIGFDVFEVLGPEASAPAVRSLLDTSASAHAALFLLHHDLASGDQVGQFATIGPVVDSLAAASEDPQTLQVLWEQIEQSEFGTDDLLDQIWRHEAPETLVVLEALGKALSKTEAKAARKALMRHRSWMAQR